MLSKKILFHTNIAYISVDINRCGNRRISMLQRKMKHSHDIHEQAFYKISYRVRQRRNFSFVLFSEFIYLSVIRNHGNDRLSKRLSKKSTVGCEFPLASFKC